jgi:hypothetical protein
MDGRTTAFIAWFQASSSDDSGASLKPWQCWIHQFEAAGDAAACGACAGLWTTKDVHWHCRELSKAMRRM